MVRFVVTDVKWEILKSLLQNEKKIGRPRVVDDRMIVEAILYIMSSPKV